MTTKQELFVAEYLIDFNATQAAIRAGYSEGSAGSQGNENMQKPEIKAAISQRVEELLGGRYKAIYDSLQFWQRMRDNTEAGEAARLKASEYYAKYFDVLTDKIKVEHLIPEEAYKMLEGLYK